MANCKSYAYPGFGDWANDKMSYTQAIRVENRIHCSGQGGWKPDSSNVDLDNLFPATISDEIDQAFANVDHNLKHAGGQGWVQVYKVVTYSTDIPSQNEHILRNLRKWMPGHKAIWTELGVAHLGAPDMHFEIDVEAYDPEDAKKEGSKA